jgi:hypothetical protein
MKELIELSKIITNQVQGSAPLLNLKDRNITKEAALFNIIQQKQCENDAQASKIIYGKPDDPRYPMLKSRLRRKMYNHLFFLDFTDPQFPPHLEIEQESLNLLHQAKMLLNSANFDMAEVLVKRSFKIAKELGFISICSSCLETIRYLHTLNGRVDQFYKNKKLLDYYHNLIKKEQEAEELFYQSWLELNRPVNTRSSYLIKMPSILAHLKFLWEEHQILSVFGYYYRLNIWYHELLGDFDRIISITKETDTMLQEGLIHPLRFDVRYNKYTQVYAYLRVKDFERGLQLAAEYLPSIHPATNNWFAYMGNYVLMAIHAQRYELAVELMKQVDANSAFHKITKRAKEKWTLYRAYLYFMHPTEELLHHFDYQQFMQSVPEYSKDKQGFNVAILILQFLHFLKTMQTDALLYRIESLRKYAQLHLKENASARSKAFFKLLEMVVKEDFHAGRCRQKSRYLHTRLQTTLPPGDAFAEIEIIPYEHLWDWILLTLQNQKSHVISRFR